MSKGCQNCKHLEYVDVGDSDGHDAGSGWTCNGREVYGKAETALLRNLSTEQYRNRYKRCFEQKGGM